MTFDWMPLCKFESICSDGPVCIHISHKYCNAKFLNIYSNCRLHSFSEWLHRRSQRIFSFSTRWMEFSADVWHCFWFSWSAGRPIDTWIHRNRWRDSCRRLCDRWGGVQKSCLDGCYLRLEVEATQTYPHRVEDYASILVWRCGLLLPLLLFSGRNGYPVMVVAVGMLKMAHMCYRLIIKAWWWILKR